jgi:hypothetical protein
MDSGMNGRRHRILIAAAGALLFLLMTLLTLPLLLRDRVEGWVRAAVEERVEAEVSWSGARLSLLRSFPAATLTLRDLEITGVGAFRGDTLAQVSSIHLVLDARSVIGSLRGTSPLAIRSVDVLAPEVRLVVLEDGSRNWDIGVADEEQPERPGRPLDVSLRGLRVQHGSLSLDDRESGMRMDAHGVSHSLSGDLRRERVTLRTRTEARSLSLRMAGLPVLSRSELEVGADLDLDRVRKTLAIADADVRLDALRLALSGSVGLGGEALGLDLAFRAPSTDIRQILSLLPAIRSGGTADLETAGSMSVAGWVRGAYGEGAFPAFAAEVAVADGMFRSPGLELPARDIALALTVSNPGGAADHTVLDLTRFRTVIGAAPIEGRLRVENPVSDPRFDLRVAGRLDLAQLARTVVLEGADGLAGIITADAEVAARASDIDARRYGAMHAAGDVRVQGVAWHSAGLDQPVRIDEALLHLSPAYASISGLRGRIGSSDALVNGRMENPLAYALRDEPLTVRGRIASERLNLNEWRSDAETEAVLVPAGLDLMLDAEVGRVTLADLDLARARGSLRVLDQRATLDGFRMEGFGGTVEAAGTYETSDPHRPTFDMRIGLRDIDVADAAARVESLRAVAPIVSHVQGRLSSDLQLRGALQADLEPVLDLLSGTGVLETDEIRVQGFPPLTALADRLDLEALREPRVSAVRAAFTIAQGRVFVSPFDVSIAGLNMTVSGSHGVDQTMDYSLAMRVPAGPLGGAASRALGAAAARLGQPAADPGVGGTLTVGARVTGTVNNPSVALVPGATTAPLAEGAQRVLDAEIGRRRAGAEQRVEDATSAARAAAEAEAQQRAAELRGAAQQRAETIRREAREQADALVARARNPVARAAAQRAANRILGEADAEAERVLQEGEARVGEVQAGGDAEVSARGQTEP